MLYSVIAGICGVITNLKEMDISNGNTCYRSCFATSNGNTINFLEINKNQQLFTSITAV
jgi:hypothetical protein